MQRSHDYPLQSLSVGEIFRRAMAMFVQNSLLFTAIVLIVRAPFALLEAAFLPQARLGIAQVLDQMRHPNHHPQTAAAVPPAFIILTVAAVAMMLLLPIIAAAIAAGVAKLYDGKAMSLRTSYRAAWARLPQIVGAAAIGILILFGAYSIASTALLVLSVVGVLALRAQAALGVFILGICAAGALAALVLVLGIILACAFAVFSATLEGADVVAAVARAFRRLFNRREIRKALLVAAAYLGVQLGVFLVDSLLAAMFVNVGGGIPDLVVSTIVTSMTTAYLSIVAVVYYYEVRTRSEGLDLERALLAIASPDAPSAYASTAYASGEERLLIQRFLERRDALEPARRAALATELASRIRPRASGDFGRLGDEALLERL